MNGKDSILYLTRHVFLPPELPQKDDFNPKYEKALLDIVVETIDKFGRYFARNDDNLARSVLSAMQNMRAMYNESTGTTVDERLLADALEDICNKGNGCVFLSCDWH